MARGATLRWLPLGILALAAVSGMIFELGAPQRAVAQGPVTVAAGATHSCALVGGAVKCWGNNDFGKLGNGTFVPSLTPVDVLGLSSGVTAIAVGDDHTCAITTAGAVRCWGANYYGQLGDGSTVARAVPVNAIGLQGGVASVSAGGGHSCGVLTSGGVRCWGLNLYGQLGADSDEECAMFPCSTTPVDVELMTPSASNVSAGGWHTCLIDGSGGVQCWGKNSDGQLGRGTTSDFEQQPMGVVDLSAGVLDVSAGNYHTCAALDGGGVHCWGRNLHGELGDGSLTDRNVPAAVAELESAVLDVSVGGTHSCAAVEAGGIKCWGQNGNGALGDGHQCGADVCNTPTDVIGSDFGPSVGAGSAHTCASTATGGARCWGNDLSGQLGDGTTTNSLKPVDVVGLKGILFGDAQCDGRVDSIDAALVLQLIAALVPSLSCEEGADVNVDGQLNALDAALILQYSAGLLNHLPP